MELTKLASTRSQLVVLALVPVLGVTAALLLMALSGPADPAEVGAAGILGPNLARWAALALGVLVISSEYGPRTIDATLLVVARRHRVLVAKAAVLAGAGWLAGALSGASVLVAAALVTGSWSVVPVAAVPMLGLQTALVAVLGLGVGAVLRSAVGGLCAVFAVFAVVPFLPVWPVALVPYLPHAATAAMLDTSGADAFGLPLGPAVAVTAGWAAMALLAGSVVLRSTDA
jgi:ABC-2 type transport system permease protein